MAAICPAPNTIYASYDEAYQALRSLSIQNGYGFRLNKAYPPRTDVKTHYYYVCDKTRKYELKATKLKTSSHTTGCSFRMVIFMKDEQ